MLVSSICLGKPVAVMVCTGKCISIDYISIDWLLKLITVLVLTQITTFSNHWQSLLKILRKMCKPSFYGYNLFETQIIYITITSLAHDLDMARVYFKGCISDSRPKHK